MHVPKFDPIEGVKDPLAMTNFRLAAKTIGSALSSVSGLYSKVAAILKPAIIGGYSVDDIRYYGGDLAVAIGALGAESKTLFITMAVSVSANLTVPPNISIVVLKGGSFSISTGMTLAINGAFEAGQHQVFSGAGAVAFGLNCTAIPQWFGAAADGLADDLSPIHKAINSLASGQVVFPSGTYKVTARIACKSNVWIVGRSLKAVITGSQIGNIANDPGANHNYGYFYLNALTNVRIQTLKVDGNGSWTATPFAHPYGGGNAVGFTNEDAAIRIQGANTDIRIEGCEFTGLQYGVYCNAGGTSERIEFTGNYCHNIGTGNYFQKCDYLTIHENRIAGVYGNCTDPGDTSTANSKYADGFYLYNCRNFVVSDNEIRDIIRIGVVIEGDGVTLCEKGLISNNVIDDIHDSKGTEINAGIWIETSKADTPIDLVGNNISNSEELGIQAYRCNITGGSIRDCLGSGINGSDFHAVGVSLQGNKYGINVSNGSETNWSLTIKACRFVENTHGGLTFEMSKGFHEVSGCYFKDNGLGTAHANVYGFGIRIVRYYNDQKVVIKDNTFISTEDTGAGTGQLWGILGQAGGDFSYDVKYISGNTFLFTGSITAYPTGLDSRPVAFAYTDGATVATYEICGWNGNINSKMAQPELDGTASAGYPRFLGFANAAPSSGSFRTGDYFLRKNFAADQGWMFVCTASGSPGTWEEWGWGSIKRTGHWIVKAGTVVVEGTNLISAYGVGVSGGTDYERIDLFHNGASGARLRVTKDGTGSYRDLDFENAGQNVITLTANGSLALRQGADVASNSTISTGYGNVFNITGATTINLMSKTNINNATLAILIFDSALTLKHNQAPSGSGVPLLLAGSADWAVPAGSVITVMYDSTADAWREISRTAR